MTKNRCLLIFNMMVLLLSGAMFSACSSDSSRKVVVVNNAKVAEASEIGKKLTNHLKGVVDQLEADMTALQQKLAANPKDEAVRRDLHRSELEFTLKAKEANDMVVEKYKDAYVKAMNEYRAKNQVDIILPAEMVNSHGPAVDVTEQIITIMNTYRVSIEPESDDKVLPEANPVEKVVAPEADKPEANQTGTEMTGKATAVNKPSAPAKKKQSDKQDRPKPNTGQQSANPADDSKP